MAILGKDLEELRPLSSIHGEAKGRIGTAANQPAASHQPRAAFVLAAAPKLPLPARATEAAPQRSAAGALILVNPVGVPLIQTDHLQRPKFTTVLWEFFP
ncbi:hypothetical protein J5N97_025925 [Dioscorea zingiberensis]|uniref:Uncharacterized protein n=1 Tax=Dioscorea zingiberensis TaxID=325984 RepID=A0A9D5H6E2_9LILI|nr:hypothetical protein J5N97_025925 [Dioscorea zingiberensis]